MAEKPLVFLVHGMGMHPHGWSQEFVKTLRKAGKRYAYFKEHRLDDLIEFHEIHWGLSALLILPGNRDENLGYGALLLYRKASIGVGWLDDEDGRDGLVLVLGVELAGLIENQGRSLRQKVREVRGRLEAVGERIGAVTD